MSLSPFDSFQSRFVTYLLNFPRILFIAILLRTGPLPLKIIVLTLLVDIFSTYLKVIVSSSCTEICSGSSEPATVTWSSANQNYTYK